MRGGLLGNFRMLLEVTALFDPHWMLNSFFAMVGQVIGNLTWFSKEIMAHYAKVHKSTLLTMQQYNITKATSIRKDRS